MSGIDLTDALDDLSSGAAMLAEHCSTLPERREHALLIASAIIYADKRSGLKESVERAREMLGLIEDLELQARTTGGTQR